MNLKGCAWFISWASLACTAHAQAHVQWVAPPAWYLTPSGSEALRPGQALPPPGAVVTGRHGAAHIRSGSQWVALDENSQWEWDGAEDNPGGNALQGAVQVRRTRAPEPSATLVLYADGAWRLEFASGSDLERARSVTRLLRNSGFPVSEPVSGEAGWTVRLEGFRTAEAALAGAQRLGPMTPGVATSVHPAITPALRP